MDFTETFTEYIYIFCYLTFARPIYVYIKDGEGIPKANVILELLNYSIYDDLLIHVLKLSKNESINKEQSYCSYK